MTNTSTLLAGDLPPPIAQALRRLIRRMRGVILLRGLAAIVTVAVGMLLLVMAVDACVTLFSAWPRWVLTLAALASTVATAVWFLLIPLAHTITLTGIARAIETRHPELQERLSSAVELLTSRDMPEIRGSAALIAALAEEASQDARRVQPRAEISLKSARPYLVAAAALVAVFLAILAIFPNQIPRLLARAVAPYLNLPNVSADMLRVTPGDVVVAEGQRLEIQVDVSNPAVRRAALRKQLPGGSELIEPMTPLPPPEDAAGHADREHPRFTLTCPPAAESFRYRVHAGEALTRFYQVTVVPPPVVKRLDLRFEYPSYTGRAAVVEANSPGDIRAVAGTNVTVSATTNKPVKSADVKINGQSAKGANVQMTPGPDGAMVCQFQVRLAPKMRGRWSLTLTDDYGFTSTSGERLLEALPDKPPVVKILNPDTRKLRLKPTDQLPVTYAMTDDFGLRSAEFVIETDTRKHSAVPLDLPPPKGAASREAAGEKPLALAALPLEGARQFTFRLRATDNLPADLKGPQEGLSPPITVDLDTAAESYAAQQLKAEEHAIEKSLEKVLQELQQTKQDSAPLKKEAAKARTPDELAPRVERMRQHLGDAKAAAGELIPQAAESSFAALTPKMGQLEQEVSSANDRTGQVKLADSTPDRAAAADQADRQVDRAIATAQDLLNQLKDMGEKLQLAEALGEMAGHQADLAADKAAADQAAQPAPADWQKEQGELAKDIGNLVKDTPAALQAQLAQDKAKAKDLAAEARQLEKEQKALAKDTERLGQMQPLEQAKKNLAAEQAQLAREAGAEKIAADQAKPMNQAAQDIQADNLPQAAAEQKAAENALAQKAAGREPSGQLSATKPSPSEAQKAAQLSRRQTDLRQRTEALQAQENRLAAPMMREQASRLRTEQSQLAREATELAEQVAPVADQPKQMGAQAADNAQQAAAQIPKDMSKAAQSATQAGESLNQLAQDLGRRAAPQASDQKSSGEKASGENPSGEKASGQQPSGEKSSGEKASGEPSSGEKSSGEKSSGEKASGEKSSGQQSSGEKSSGEKSSGQPSSGQPSAGQPSSGQPSSGQPSSGQPASGQPSSGQPSPGEIADMSQQAADLAERQQQLAREMQALAAGNLPKALATEQGNLAERTADLKQEAAALGQRAQSLVPQSPAAQQAAEAANDLSQAQQSEEQAQQAMSSGSPQSAVPSQQNAAQSLGAAAQALGQLGHSLAKAAGQQPSGSPGEAAMGSEMAQANSAASEASATQSAAAAAQAAQALAQAAGQAAAAAQGQGAAPGTQPGAGKGMIPGVPGPSKNSQKGTSAQAISMTAAKLESLGIKLSDWARLPGELRSQILQAADETGPEEYRSLIKRYFQQVAKRGGTGGEENP